jgi:hypothetical protein
MKDEQNSEHGPNFPGAFPHNLLAQLADGGDDTRGWVYAKVYFSNKANWEVWWDIFAVLGR